MRRRIISIIIFCCIILLAAIVDNRYWAATSGKTKNKTIGSFEYEYKVQRGGTWITKITPKSDKDISILKIPARLGGRSVVKLGGEGDRFSIDDDSEGEYRYENLFGGFYSEDYSTRDHTVIVPFDIYDLVGEIKEIQIPKSIKWIALDAFQYVQDGKIINIPGKVKTKLENTSLTKVKWKKVSLSARNRKYKVTNGCLCSKDGRNVYGIIEDHKTITIPKGVKHISRRGDYNGADVIKIPASVIKIERELPFYGLSTINPVTIQISEENKKYAVKDGSVYDKVSGKLISGNIEDGVLKIPDTVRIVEHPCFLGDIETLRKVIVPASVTYIDFHRDRSYGSFDVTFVFEGRVPPKSEDWDFLLCDSRVYMPKGCKEIYEKEWGEAIREWNDTCAYEEMDHF